MKRGGTVITSNRPAEGWAKLVGDVVATVPSFDQRMHHGHRPKFEGRSYRIKKAVSGSAL